MDGKAVAVPVLKVVQQGCHLSYHSSWNHQKMHRAVGNFFTLNNCKDNFVVNFGVNLYR